MIKSEVVVIGAGPVGLFSIFQCGMLGMRCTVFDSMKTIGGQCTALYPEKPVFDIPGFKKIKASELIDNLFEQANSFSPQMILGEKIVRIDDNSDGFLYVHSDLGSVVQCTAVVIATGVGNIQPKRIPVDGASQLEGRFVFYSAPKTDTFHNAHVVIAGGGDSAADWGLEIGQIAKKVNIVHRRSTFKCHQHTLNELNSLSEQGKIEFITPYNISQIIIEDEKLKSIVVAEVSDNSKYIEIQADYLLAFFGLEISNQASSFFGVESTKKGIIINRDTMETSRSKVYAIGDAAYYHNRPNLILVGFSEAATACREIYRAKNPDAYLGNLPYSTAQGIPDLLVKEGI